MKIYYKKEMKIYYKLVLWFTIMLINNGILIPYLISTTSTFLVILGYISFFSNIPISYYFVQWINLIPNFKREKK